LRSRPRLSKSAAYLQALRIMGCGASTPPAAPSPAATPPVAPADPKLKKKPIKEWSGDEVRNVLVIFRQFDADGSGAIDAGELQALCKVLMIEATVDEADIYTKDGKIDPQEFFAFYVGCTRAEAASAFVHHAQQFHALRAKGSLKTWTAQEVKDVLAVLKQFDADSSGFIDAAELQALCNVLGVEASVQEADIYKVDGKIDACEFFAWYAGCSREEAEQCFKQHAMIFAQAGAA